MNVSLVSLYKDIRLKCIIPLLFFLAFMLTGVLVNSVKAQENIEGTYTLMPMGHQSVPKAITNASGLFTLKIQNDTLMVKGKFQGLSSAHHRSYIGVGPTGEVGNVLFTLDVELTNQEHTNGKVEYADNKFELLDIHKELIRQDEFYIAVSSNNYKMGEIRDQLVIEE